MAKKKPETYVKASIREWLRLHNWYVVNIHAGMGAHKGISDLIAVKKGYVIFIEIKVPNNPRSMQSLEQREFERRIISHGAHYIVARHYQFVEQYIKTNCPEAI